jgi:hypothetical protein
VRQYLGTSVGRWEGDTLVTETVAFKPLEALRVDFGLFLYVSPDSKVTERFTMTGKDEFLYEIFMNEKNYKDAVEPAVRVLAGLLETQNYHHGWEPGMALLRGALDAKPPLPAGTEWPQVLHDLEGLGLAAQAGLFRSSYGCFASGRGSVSMPDEWFAPERVEKAVREAMTARPSPPPSQ